VTGTVNGTRHRSQLAGDSLSPLSIFCPRGKAGGLFHYVRREPTDPAIRRAAFIEVLAETLVDVLAEPAGQDAPESAQQGQSKPAENEVSADA